MRAADQAHLSPADSDDQSHGLVSRLVMVLVATFALLLVWRPSVLHGQEATAAVVEQPPVTETPDKQVTPAKPAPASRTHVVKPGETLWSLAARYYGDGHSWQALAKRNNIPTAGDKPPLEVGMRLSVPANAPAMSAKAAAVAAAPADSTVPKVALAKAGQGSMPQLPPETKGADPSELRPLAKAPAGSLAAQTSGKADAEPVSGSRGGATRAAPKTPREPAPAPTPTVTIASASSTSEHADTSRADFSRQRGTVMARDGAVRIGLVDADDQTAARKATEVLTVFHRDLPNAAEAERRTLAILRPNTPAPRQGELDAAPYIVSEAYAAATGTITARVGAPGDAMGVYKQRAVKTDEIEVQAPVKGRYAIGDRLQAFTTTPSSEKGKLVATPTGVVEVVKLTASGGAIAVVREQSGRIEQGQRLVATAGTPAPRSDLTNLDTPDLSTSIMWLDPTQVLPTLQSFVVMAAGAPKGVKPGDEFAFYYKPKGGVETVTARARVVRADSEGSTAVIIKQFGSEIQVGMTARRVGRAP